jgi:uncharacterized protein YqfA (UPF0365 family)
MPCAIGVIFLIFAIVFLSTFLRFGNLWRQAWSSNAPISFPELIGMKLRKVDLRLIVQSYIRARNAGLSITVQQLETQYLAGARVSNVVEALIAARAVGMQLDWNTASAIDLAGGDILDEVRSRIGSDGLAKLRPEMLHAR